MSEQVPAGSLSGRVAEEVRLALFQQRKSQRALADDLDVSPMWVNDRVNRVKDITLNDLERIATALSLPVSEFLPADVIAAAGVA